MVLLSVYNIGGISLNARTQRAIGFFMGLAALVIVLANLRYDGFPDEAVRWIAYVVFVAGAASMFWGARSLPD
jgi:hypothetical protein